MSNYGGGGNGGGGNRSFDNGQYWPEERTNPPRARASAQAETAEQNTKAGEAPSSNVRQLPAVVGFFDAAYYDNLFGENSTAISSINQLPSSAEYYGEQSAAMGDNSQMPTSTDYFGTFDSNFTNPTYPTDAAFGADEQPNVPPVYAYLSEPPMNILDSPCYSTAEKQPENEKGQNVRATEQPSNITDNELPKRYRYPIPFLPELPENLFDSPPYTKESEEQAKNDEHGLERSEEAKQESSTSANVQLEPPVESSLGQSGVTLSAEDFETLQRMIDEYLPISPAMQEPTNYQQTGDDLNSLQNPLTEQMNFEGGYRAEFAIAEEPAATGETAANENASSIDWAYNDLLLIPDLNNLTPANRNTNVVDAQAEEQVGHNEVDHIQEEINCHAEGPRFETVTHCYTAINQEQATNANMAPAPAEALPIFYPIEHNELRGLNHANGCQDIRSTIAAQPINAAEMAMIDTQNIYPSAFSPTHTQVIQLSNMPQPLPTNTYGGAQRFDFGHENRCAYEQTTNPNHMVNAQSLLYIGVVTAPRGNGYGQQAQESTVRQYYYDGNERTFAGQYANETNANFNTNTGTGFTSFFPDIPLTEGAYGNEMSTSQHDWMQTAQSETPNRLVPAEIITTTSWLDVESEESEDYEEGEMLYDENGEAYFQKRSLLSKFDSKENNPNANGVPERSAVDQAVTDNSESETDSDGSPESKRRRSCNELECPDCGIEFKTRYDLRLHVKEHTNVRIHRCAFCNYESTNAETVRKHFKKKHPVIVNNPFMEENLNDFLTL